jgi:hypothetical protein
MLSRSINDTYSVISLVIEGDVTTSLMIVGDATTWNITSGDSRGVINYHNIFFKQATGGANFSSLSLILYNPVVSL